MNDVVADACRVARVAFARGETVFHQGQEGDRAYYVERGRVRVVRAQDGGETTLGIVEAGSLLGELALVDDAPRYGTAVCETDTVLLSFSRAYLEDAMRRADPLLPTLIEVLIRRFRETADRDARTKALPRDGRLRDLPPRGADLFEQLNFEHDLLRAMSRPDELYLLAQPIVRASDDTTAGHELLLRWQHPERGLVPPGDFIAAAAARGLIADLGRWVLSAAVAAARSLVGGPVGFVSVNVEPEQLFGSDLVGDVAEICRAGDLHPSALKLEITESELMGHPETAEAILRGLSDLGCSLAIDDFGTGYSAFSHLHRYPFDTLKIDKSFVRPMLDDDRSRRLVKALVHLAGDLGLDVVAEGVETAEHATCLRALGCTYLQGYRYGRPARLGTD